jgi:hypothetical protein
MQNKKILLLSFKFSFIFSVQLVLPTKKAFPSTTGHSSRWHTKNEFIFPKNGGHSPPLLALALTTGAALHRERKLSPPPLHFLFRIEKSSEGGGSGQAQGPTLKKCQQMSGGSATQRGVGPPRKCGILTWHQNVPRLKILEGDLALRDLSGLSARDNMQIWRGRDILRHSFWAFSEMNSIQDSLC